MAKLLQRLIVALFLLCGSTITQAQHWLYSFRPGDTLWDLCLEYTVVPNCWLTIGAENEVDYPRRIPPGTIIKFPVNWLKNIPEPATITFVQGEVFYQVSSVAQAIEAEAGVNLPIGARVTVGEDSSATVTFANQSILVLEEDSVLELDALSVGGDGGMADARLRLLRGAVTTKVPKREQGIRFEIETPAAVAAVRGTEFRVSSLPSDAESMRAEVLEGLVDVANTVDLQQVAMGFGLVASANAPVPEPVELLPAPVFISSTVPQVSNLNVNWNVLDGAQGYRLDLLTDQVDADLLNSRELSETSFTWENLPEACYQIAVRGIDVQLLQGIPERMRICVIPPLARVDIQSDNLQKVPGNSIEVQWLALENIDHYEVEISYDENFSNLVNTITSRENRAIIDISEQRKHFVRVRAINQVGVKSEPGLTGSWSPSRWDRIVAGVATVAVLLALL